MRPSQAVSLLGHSPELPDSQILLREYIFSLGYRPAESVYSLDLPPSGKEDYDVRHLQMMVCAIGATMMAFGQDTSPPATPPGIAWQAEFEAALDLAKKKNQPIMVAFVMVDEPANDEIMPGSSVTTVWPVSSCKGPSVSTPRPAPSPSRLSAPAATASTPRLPAAASA
jgi:hypothetical protein